MKQRLVLFNFEEVGFRKQPYIDFTDSDSKNFCVLYFNGDTSFHSTVQAAKRYIRNECSIKGKTPRFKWVVD